MLDTDGAFAVNTGDPTSPVVLDFDELLIDFQLAGRITVANTFALAGLLTLEIDSQGLKLLAAAQMVIGPDLGTHYNATTGVITGTPMLNISALGVVVINAHGFAADLDVDLDVGLGGALDLTVSARVIVNLTGEIQKVEIPDRLLDFLVASSSPLAHDLLARLVTDSDGSKSYTISKFAPDITDPTTVFSLLAGTGTITPTTSTNYVVAVVSGSFSFVGFATGTGTAGISVSPTLFQFYADLDFSIGVSGIDLDFSVDGTMEVSAAGLYLSVGVELDANITSLFELDVTGTLLIDTRGATDLFRLTLNGDLTVARILTVSGGVTIEVGVDGVANTWRLAMNLSGDLGPIGVSVDGFIQSDGQFSLTASGHLFFGIDGFSIAGDVSGTLSLIKSGKNYVYSPSDTYTLTARSHRRSDADDHRHRHRRQRNAWWDGGL